MLLTNNLVAFLFRLREFTGLNISEFYEYSMYLSCGWTINSQYKLIWISQVLSFEKIL